MSAPSNRNKARRSGSPKVRSGAGRITPKGSKRPSGGGASLRAEATPSRVTPPGTPPRPPAGANKIRDHAARARGYRPAPTAGGPLMAVSATTWASEKQRQAVLRGVLDALGDTPEVFR